MSTVVLGKNSVLEINDVAFTGVAAGTDNITAGDAQDTRQIPGGRGAKVFEFAPHATYDFSFACDSNVVHDQQLRAANGQRLRYAWYPEGKTSGRIRFTGSAVATVSLGGDVTSDAMRWTVTLAVDGTPTQGTAP